MCCSFICSFFSLIKALIYTQRNQWNTPTLPYCCPRTAWWQSESCSWVQRQHWGNPWHASTAGPSPPVGGDGHGHRHTHTENLSFTFYPHLTNTQSSAGLMFGLHPANLHSGKCWAGSGRDSHWWNINASWHGAQETSHHESTCKQDFNVPDAPE